VTVLPSRRARGHESLTRRADTHVPQPVDNCRPQGDDDHGRRKPGWRRTADVFQSRAEPSTSGDEEAMALVGSEIRYQWFALRSTPVLAERRSGAWAGVVRDRYDCLENGEGERARRRPPPAPLRHPGALFWSRLVLGYCERPARMGGDWVAISLPLAATPPPDRHLSPLRHLAVQAWNAGELSTGRRRWRRWRSLTRLFSGPQVCK
jgi:hypothetical protein